MSITSAKPHTDGLSFIVQFDDGAVLHVPDDMANRYRRELQEWLDAGGVLDPLFTLDELRSNKKTEFIAEGVTRIAAQVSDWNPLDTIKPVAGLWVSHLAANATAAQLTAKDIYLYVRDTAPAKLAAVTTQAGLDAIDPTAADPFGDGTPWPI